MNLPKLLLWITVALSLVIAGFGIYEIVANSEDNQPSTKSAPSQNELEYPTRNELVDKLIVSTFQGVTEEEIDRVLFEASDTLGFNLTLGNEISDVFRLVDLSSSVTQQQAREISRMLLESGLFISAEPDSALQLQE